MNHKIGGESPTDEELLEQNDDEYYYNWVKKQYETTSDIWVGFPIGKRLTDGKHGGLCFEYSYKLILKVKGENFSTGDSVHAVVPLELGWRNKECLQSLEWEQGWDRKVSFLFINIDEDGTPWIDVPHGIYSHPLSGPFADGLKKLLIEKNWFDARASLVHTPGQKQGE